MCGAEDSKLKTSPASGRVPAGDAISRKSS